MSNGVHRDLGKGNSKQTAWNKRVETRTGLIESKEQQGDQYGWNSMCVKESRRRGRKAERC